MESLKIRHLTAEDAKMVFGWRNDPYIISLGSLNKEVTWEEHLDWFKNTLSGLQRKAFILEINNIPSGQVRFDLHSSDSCVISIYLLKEFSGKGLGVEFIKRGCDKIFLEWKEIKTIYALVRDENIIGQKAFIKSGFKEDGSFKNDLHVTFSLNRNVTQL